MSGYFWTKHALSRINERSEIKELWVIDCIENPDKTKLEVDEAGDKIHYYKRIVDFDNRVLEVIVSANSTPPRIISLFFNRNLRNKL
ncbi:DUF4258 domain-containing protein [Cyanobacterium sp. IPPAS B-1200]|uniref:DUF4258 domain-containing protein n=1 Tax=Cyanobacterium sp. IPPAS B-1200 TaxID=1562720 RepID=UPI0008527DC7|nr:DUF4258 domain-containing protein [Cyanobacterium sp. IPPAS B-1200]OEJ79494.1 hypothetical protein A5482_01170 [Cyanobacterium sp. IPPAS B-1200]